RRVRGGLGLEPDVSFCRVLHIRSVFFLFFMVMVMVMVIVVVVVVVMAVCVCVNFRLHWLRPWNCLVVPSVLTVELFINVGCIGYTSVVVTDIHIENNPQERVQDLRRVAD
ncbi:unnamed protein product, partial [Discosporangium mesarthrocarpum]